MVNQEVSQEQIMKTLEAVMDPEVPVLSVLDLGVIRRVKVKNLDVEIDISPTYTGAPPWMLSLHLLKTPSLLLAPKK